MENTQSAVLNNNQELPNSKKTNLVSLVGGFGLLVVGVVIGASVTFSMTGGIKQPLMNNEIENLDNNQDLAVTSFASLKPSTFGSFAQVIDGKFYVVPVSSGIGVFSPNLNIQWGSSGYGMGSSDPISSPDSQKIAVIEKDTRNLLLMTADGKQQVRVSDQLQVDFISGWSPDSTKLIVLASSPTIRGLFVPEGPVPAELIAGVQKLKPSTMASGYYLVDLVKNEIKLLTYFTGSSFITWVDENRVLLNVDEVGVKKYVVFDLNTLEANADLLAGALDSYFGEQISIDKNGQNWALTLSPTELIDSDNSEAKIVLAIFPSITGQVIGEGKFAQVQSPIISPNGDKVIFRGYDVVNGPNFVYYYDGTKTERLFEGLPRKWVNNDKFIYSLTNETGATNPDLTTEIYLYDTQSKKSEKLF